MLASCWDVFRITLESLLVHFGIISGSFWDDCGIFLNHFGIILGSLWDHFGIILGSLWDHLEVTLGSLWDHFGIILGSLWDDLRVTLGSGWSYVGIIFFFLLPRRAMSCESTREQFTSVCPGARASTLS